MQQQHPSALRRALRAARALAADPDDLPQVFTLIEALSGNTIHRIQRRMAANSTGSRLLSDRPDIVDLLVDRDALRRLPADSLGRAYLDFVESENISADGIRSADREGRASELLPPPLDFVQARMRDTHDMWHAATGYRGDIVGEIALLAFTLAQTWNPAIALIIGIGLVKTRRFPGVRAALVDGFRRGRKAAWFPALEWEALIALPLEEVRRRLVLDAAPSYQPLRTHEVVSQRRAA